MSGSAKPEFLYTRHAQTTLHERQIDRRWVEQTLIQPEYTEPDPESLGVMRAFRRIPDRDGRTLRVVYVPDGNIFELSQHSSTEDGEHEDNL